MNKVIVAVAIVIVVLIIIIIWQRIAASRANTKTLAQFATGFWRASAVDCEAGGYSSAYLYVAQPEGTRAKGYIVAVRGESGAELNSAVDIEFVGDDCADITIDENVTRMTIARNFALGEMRWLDEDEVALFTWEKNSDITRAIAPAAPIAQDDTSSISI
jgi:hypothetical protein